MTVGKINDGGKRPTLEIGSRVRLTNDERLRADVRGCLGEVMVPPSKEYPDEVSILLDGTSAPMLFDPRFVEIDDAEERALKEALSGPWFSDAEKLLIRWRLGACDDFTLKMFNFIDAARTTDQHVRVRQAFRFEAEAHGAWRASLASAAAPFAVKLAQHRIKLP